jgi:hypothetical protein
LTFFFYIFRTTTKLCWLPDIKNPTIVAYSGTTLPIIPPYAMVLGVWLPSREMTSVINMVGQTSQAVGLLNPESPFGVGLGLYEVGVLVYGGNDSDVGISVIQGPVAGIVTLA